MLPRTGTELIHISIHTPARGATHDDRCCDDQKDISIHAPREGGDYFQRLGVDAKAHFNPRPPRGGRLMTDTMMEG